MDASSGSFKGADRPGSLMRRKSSKRLVEPEYVPDIEWKETPEAHVLEVDLPGFKYEDVKVQLDTQGNLIVNGERLVEETVFVEGVWRPRQRLGFKFKRVCSIPENVNTTNITTKFENESLYITLNKLTPPPEIKSTNILDQENKSIPQVGESSARFIEESKEKKNDKESSNKPDQNLRDQKVETLEVVNSNATQVDKASSNNLVQIPRVEKDKTLGVVKFSATLEGKELNNKNDQIPRDDKVETTRVANSSTNQDDKALSDKLDQSQRDENVEILGIAKSGTTQDDKELSNKPDQSPRDENVENPQVAKPIVAQDSKASSNQPSQSPIDKKVEISEVTKTSATQLDNEKVETLEVAKSNKNQDAIQMEKQLEVSYKIGESTKHSSSLNEEILVDSNTLPKQFELPDSDQEEDQMDVGDQQSSPPHEDHIQETKVSSSNTKKEDKNTLLKVCPYVSQFISSSHELAVVVAIVVFSLVLYITYTSIYP